jgi:hypothetical protein
MKASKRYRRAKRTFKRIVKGKVFEKSEFGTGLSDYTLYGLLSQQKSRPDGTVLNPVKLVIEPTKQASQSLSPVQIYIGSEPSQHRAERVLLWSIYRERNPERHYDVFLMNDLVGFERAGWKTGFTAYRYAIPELAGYRGRAIYNDVDQIYLEDPGFLFDEAMDDAAILALGSIDTSVMLMECPALEQLWSIEAIAEAPRERLHAAMLDLLRGRDLAGDLPPDWNARDHEYTAGQSKLLHYTILHTQPWVPFPSKLRYSENANADVWNKLESEADENGFAPAWKSSPARSYSEMEGFFRMSPELDMSKGAR